jgi:small subunit ribosomal protein S16
MVLIRLKRLGSTRKPFYRVVVTDSCNRKAGAYLDLLGIYDPKPKNEILKIEKDKLDGWIKKGAQMTPKVKALVRRLKDETAGGGDRKAAGGQA